MAAASSSNLRLQQISVEQSSEQQSEFVAFRATMRLPIAPVWAADGSAGGALGTGGMEGVKEVLASWVMRSVRVRLKVSFEYRRAEKRSGRAGNDLRAVEGG